MPPGPIFSQGMNLHRAKLIYTEISQELCDLSVTNKLSFELYYDEWWKWRLLFVNLMSKEKLGGTITISFWQFLANSTSQQTIKF